MKIYTVRHTSVDVPQDTCYGQTDVPLKKSFEQEAKIVKQKLEGLDFDVIFSSPLSRCKKLAEYCGFEDALLYDRLKEIHLGEWEMRNFEQINTAMWDNDWIEIPAPNGESFKQMYDRVASFYEELKTMNYKNVLIFTHGGVINCTRAYFGKAELKDGFDNLADYGQICEFEL